MLVARRRLNARSVPDVIRRKSVYAYISVAADAIQVDSARILRPCWFWMPLGLGDRREGTKLSPTSVLAEMSDKADEDLLYIELGSNGFDVSLRGQLLELRIERLR